MHAVIDDAAGLFTLINTFEVSPGKQDALVAMLRQFTEQHARLLPGFVAASVHASLNGDRVVNYVQWQTEADLAAMMAGAEAKAHVAAVAGLAEHIDPVAYRVAFIGSRGRAPE